MYLSVLTFKLDIGLLATVAARRSMMVNVVLLCWSAEAQLVQLTEPGAVRVLDPYLPLAVPRICHSTYLPASPCSVFELHKRSIVLLQ